MGVGRERETEKDRDRETKTESLVDGFLLNTLITYTFGCIFKFIKHSKS